MPFLPHLISNWVQHRVLDGRCIRCGETFAIDGVLWAKDGAIFTRPPITNWTECEP